MKYWLPFISADDLIYEIIFPPIKCIISLSVRSLFADKTRLTFNEHNINGKIGFDRWLLANLALHRNNVKFNAIYDFRPIVRLNEIIEKPIETKISYCCVSQSNDSVITAFVIFL